MPSPTYVALAKTVLTGTQTSVTFNPTSSYTDLLILVSVRTDRADYQDPIQIRFNGATVDTNLTTRILYGAGTTSGSVANSYAYAGTATASTATSNTFSSIEIYLPNYNSSTTKPISVTSVQENNSTTNNEIDAIAGLWNSTNAITSMTLIPRGGVNFVSGSRFDLYGIKNS